MRPACATLRGATRGAALLVLALSALARGAPAHAHDKLVSRAVKVETADDRLYVWISLTVPSGLHKDALLAATPRRRDGTLDPAGKKGLERALAVRALDGLALWVDGATVALDRAELSLKAPPAPDAPLELAILGSAPLAARAERVGLTVLREGDPTELSLLRGTRPVVWCSRGAVMRGAVETVMGSPDRVRWRIAPAGSTGAASAPPTAAPPTAAPRR